MPLLSIPTKAKKKYLSFVKEHNSETNKKKRSEISMKAHHYLDAVKDICGTTVAGHILIEGDLSLPDDNRPACGGMYLDLD